MLKQLQLVCKLGTSSGFRQCSTTAKWRQKQLQVMSVTFLIKRSIILIHSKMFKQLQVVGKLGTSSGFQQCSRAAKWWQKQLQVMSVKFLIKRIISLLHSKTLNNFNWLANLGQVVAFDNVRQLQSCDKSSSAASDVC